VGKASRRCRACLKRDGTRADTRFGLSAKRTSPFKLAGPGGVSVQSTTGSLFKHYSVLLTYVAFSQAR